MITHQKTIPIGGRCWRVALSDDGQRAAVASYYDLELWDLCEDTPRWKQHFPEAGGIPASLALSPDQRVLAMACRKKLRLLDVDTGALLRELDPGAYSGRMRFARDGARLFLAGKELLVCDVASGAVIARMAGPRTFNGFALDASERTLAAVGDKSLWIYDLATHQLLHRYPYARFGATSVSLSPDGKSSWVSQAGEEATLIQIGKKSKKVLAVCSPGGMLTELVTAPDGRWLLLTSEDGLTLHSPDGALLARIDGWPECRVDDLSVSLDGARLLSAHLDGTARLWAIKAG